MVEILKQIHPLRLTFVTNTQTLSYYAGSNDLCPVCQRYQKHVQFSLLDLDQPTSIYVRSALEQQRRISAFPQTMQWYINRQGFVTVYHRDLRAHSCKACVIDHGCLSFKRALSVDKEEQRPRKRPRI